MEAKGRGGSRRAAFLFAALQLVRRKALRRMLAPQSPGVLIDDPCSPSRMPPRALASTAAFAARTPAFAADAARP